METGEDQGLEVCGRVKWFDSVKGYGFIVVEDIDSDILIHYNLLAGLGRKSLPEGSTVRAVIRQGPRGFQAVAIDSVDVSTATVIESASGRRKEKSSDLDLSEHAGAFERATVRWFNRAKGYGFLFCADGVTQAFIHAETIRRQGFESLEPEQTLLARIAHGPRGALVVEIRAPD